MKTDGYVLGHVAVPASNSCRVSVSKQNNNKRRQRSLWPVRLTAISSREGVGLPVAGLRGTFEFVEEAVLGVVEEVVPLLTGKGDNDDRSNGTANLHGVIVESHLDACPALASPVPSRLTARRILPHCVPILARVRLRTSYRQTRRFPRCQRAGTLQDTAGSEGADVTSRQPATANSL